MTHLSSQTFREGVRASIASQTSALTRLRSHQADHITIDMQMTAVKVMAEAVLNLRSLTPNLMNQPSLPLQSMLSLALHTRDAEAFHFALREFTERTNTILDMDEAINASPDDRAF